MATVPKHYITPEEYIEQERKSEYRSEYLDGEVFPMSGASRNHGLIVTNLVGELRQKLRDRPCNVYSSSLSVRVSPTGLYTYPDVVVTCGEEQFLDNSNDMLLNPLLIIEVLSGSTADYDRGRKFESYRTLPSLKEYLTIAQDKVHIEQWQRQKDGRWLLTEHFDRAASITLDPIDIELPLTDIYEKVGVRQQYCFQPPLHTVNVTISSERPYIDFSLYAIRFYFRAIDPIYFPPGKAANIFRGAFGHIFRRLACVPQCKSAKSCNWRETCPYARLFEPIAIGVSGPSGLADRPRPFALRAMHLDGKVLAPGATFFLDLNLFDPQPSVVGYLALTFAQLVREGLGPKRGRVELTSACLLTESGEVDSTIFENGSEATKRFLPPLRLDLTPVPEQKKSIHRLRIRFMTPTELKIGQQLASRPEFFILASRIRDRLSALRELYGAGPLDLDFRRFGEQSKTIQLVDCNLNHVDLNRHSSRTGQTHPIGGFTGEAEYEGNLRPFLPFLYAAQWTGVGRQTVWGKGQIAIVVPST